MKKMVITGLVLTSLVFLAVPAYAADKTPPTGTININNNAAATRTTSVVLRLSATDTGGRVIQMKFSNNNSTWSSAQTYTTSKTWSLLSGNGQKTVYVKFRDAAGNWSAAYSDTIILDAAAPTGSVNINNGASYTNSVSANLAIAAQDNAGGSGLSQMRFSADNSTWSTAEAYSTAKAYTLVSGDGTKTVYVKVSDAAGNWSSAFSDSIVVDTAAPTGTIKINNGASTTTSAKVTLSLSAADNLSGISQMQFSNNNSTWTTPEAYSATKSSYYLTSGYGQRTVYVKFKDAAGNWSAAYSASIKLLDYMPPAGYVKINADASATNKQAVALTLLAVDSGSGMGAGAQMRFSNDNSAWTAPQAYARTKAWTLAAGDGIKTVYVKFKDAAGNWSAALRDTIILDTRPPKIIITSPTDGAMVDTADLTVNYTVDGVQKTKLFTLVPGQNTITISETDAAGNVSIVSIMVMLRSMGPDEQFLDDTEAKAALYFYNEVLSNGFVKDGSHKDFSSIAATGFGLASMCVMAERYGTTAGWTVTPEQARARVNQILDECIRIQNLQTTGCNEYGVAGFLYHFINSQGAQQYGSEVSTVDMALFLAGAVAAGEYFGGDTRAKVEQIYSKLNWSYFLISAKKQFSHGWNSGSVLPATWDRPGDETLLVSLMALSSEPENKVFLGTMYSWPRTVRSYGSYKVVNSYFSSLFTYIFAHCYFDFEKLGKDNPLLAISPADPVNWWANSVAAANANRQFCIEQSATYASYGPDSWGITSCEYPAGGYAGLIGAAPCEVNDGNPIHDGTIAPYGAISSLPLMRIAPNESLADNLAFKALKFYSDTYYNNLWGPYGPRDSFDNQGGFNSNYLGIDVGAEVLMIENYRTRLIWDNFMNNSRIKAAVTKVFNNELPAVKILFVNAANVSDPGQNGSAAHPFSSIQRAIDAVKESAVISVAAGTYPEHLILKSDISLIGSGGSVSTPADVSDDTIIDGTDNGCPVYSDGISGVTIEGFTIKNGSPNASGGNILCNNSSVKIKNNLITNGRTNSTGSGGYGGGIFANSSSVDICNNVIQGNWAWGLGGGIYLNNCDGVLAGNIIFNNVSDSGAGVCCISSDLVIANNIFSKNFADYAHGGGILCIGASPVIKNNIIVDNVSGQWGHGLGGGIACCSGSSPTIVNNIICYNSVNGSAGGIYFDSQRGVLNYNNVYGNSGGDYYNCEAGPDSISVDPAFTVWNKDTDPYNDDYQLAQGSLCINTGDPDASFNDLDGSRNDMGVYGGPTPYSLVGN